MNRFLFAASAAFLVLSGCGGGGGGVAALGEGGSDVEPLGFPFTVSATYQGVFPGCGEGDPATGDPIRIALSGDAMTVEDAGAGCHAVFTGVGAIADERTGSTLLADFVFDIDLAGSCEEAASMSLEQLLATDYEMTLSGEASGVACEGRRADFEYVEFGEPVPLDFVCEGLGDGCPATLDGALSADFDILSAIREAAAE